MPGDVVVVAARDAWPEYQQHSAYVCQPDRHFRPGTSRLAFYAEGAIQPLVPAIEHWRSSVPFTRAEAAGQKAGGDARLGALIERLLLLGPRVEGTNYGVMFLSGPDDDETVKLPGRIVNDSTSPAGRRVAWTRWQRYIELAALESGASRTSEL